MASQFLKKNTKKKKKVDEGKNPLGEKCLHPLLELLKPIKLHCAYEVLACPVPDFTWACFALFMDFARCFPATYLFPFQVYA